MLLFCPTCGNVLIVEEGQKCYRFACNTCPYVHNINRKVTSRKYPKLKEVDDVLGGSAAWENVDSTAGSFHTGRIRDDPPREHPLAQRGSLRGSPLSRQMT
ncbi:hypothetical protein AB205_0166470, partial [Aquarana catesbeiana]